MSRLSFVSWFAVAALVCVGCGPTPPRMVEVDGTVTMDGKPLEKIHVEFWPETNGPKSFGLTDDQGKFSLSYEDGSKKGAVVGKHKVVLQDTSIIVDKRFGREVENVDVTGGKKPRILDAYGSPTSSTLTAEVTDEKRSVDFDVKPYAGP